MNNSNWYQQQMAAQQMGNNGLGSGLQNVYYPYVGPTEQLKNRIKVIEQELEKYNEDYRKSLLLELDKIKQAVAILEK